MERQLPVTASLGLFRRTVNQKPNDLLREWLEALPGVGLDDLFDLPHARTMVVHEGIAIVGHEVISVAVHLKCLGRILERFLVIAVDLDLISLRCYGWRR